MKTNERNQRNYGHVNTSNTVPVEIWPEVMDLLVRVAAAKGMEVNELANALLRYTVEEDDAAWRMVKDQDFELS